MLLTCIDGEYKYYDDKTEPPVGKSPTTSLSDKRDPISKATQWIINDLQGGFVLENIEK